MTDKKDPGKFTIRFNICDPQHKAVIDLLNRQGRSKAQFLVSAVLHYINCKETPEVSVPVPDQAALEEMRPSLRWGLCYSLILAVVIFGAYGTGYQQVDLIYAEF